MKILDYLFESLPADVPVESQFRLLLLVVGITFSSVIVVHQFMPNHQSWIELGIHALIISATYLFSFGCFAILVYYLNNALVLTRLQVWHVWLFSFLAFNLGFVSYALFNDSFRLSLHQDLPEISALAQYMRLLPIWVLISYVFLETYLKQKFKNEAVQLARINATLQSRAHTENSNREEKWLDLSSSRKPLKILIAEISHIAVDDHYCYLFHRKPDASVLNKSEAGLSLKIILERLPERFVQIHRSYVVNPDFVESVTRSGRNFSVVMEGGEAMPISRHRQDVVIATLESKI